LLTVKEEDDDELPELTTMCPLAGEGEGEGEGQLEGCITVVEGVLV
jgi:hypothetical protein